MTTTRGRVIYFSHGGGPLPLLGDASHGAMVSFMEQLPERFERPEMILLISAHWEEKMPTLLGASQPPMLYDYYGFPEEAYRIRYLAPGNPGLTDKALELLEKNNIACRVDKTRGFDHGLYVPLLLMYPEADIPATQLSLVQGLDPATHIAAGNALRELMRENILIIGSGFSFHNMHIFSWKPDNQTDLQNDEFQDWLIETCTAGLPQNEREERLMHWEQAPSARYCHPREEHLLPLHVCAGIGTAPAEKIFDDYILGKRAVAFEWS